MKINLDKKKYFNIYVYFSCFIILSCVVLNLNTASFDDDNNDDDDHYYCYHHHFISSTIIIILIFTSVNFYFSFVSNSLAYIIIPQNNGKMKINWDKKNLLEHMCIFPALYNLPLILNLNTSTAWKLKFRGRFWTFYIWGMNFSSFQAMEPKNEPS